jgi:hypothetical protein
VAKIKGREGGFSQELWLWFFGWWVGEISFWLFGAAFLILLVGVVFV